MHSFLQAQEEKDTSNIYRKIEQKAGQYKATKFLYEAIFENADDTEDTIPIKSHTQRKTNQFRQYNGKYVRKIRIVALDPFGYSVNNLHEKQLSYFERLGNRLHATTKERIVKNILLFKPKDEIIPLEFSESERLLRNSPNFSDARIYIQKPKRKGGDSLDVVVVVQDRWSSSIRGISGGNEHGLKVTENNIFGIGHQFSVGLAWNSADHFLRNFSSYSIFNVKNTFVNVTAYDSIAKENKEIGISVDRPFYSPLARWAGGISLIKNFNTFKILNLTDEITSYPNRYNTYDVWGAVSFPLSDKKDASITMRSTNFIAGARVFHRGYSVRPGFDVDTNYINTNQTLLLTNIGYTFRSYYRDRYLYRFGANEDIPEGYAIEYIQGTTKKEFTARWYYSGVRLAAGFHINDFGYLSASFDYGTFYNKSFSGLGVVNFNALYFSDLKQRGNWYFRQFVRYRLVNGINRYAHESVNINGAQMYRFSSKTVNGVADNVTGSRNLVSGNSKMIMNLEFVMYSPYKLIGFKFAPVLLIGLATVGNGIRSLFSSTIYQSYAVGLLIRNEHLVVNTFEISIGIYPYMPGYRDFTTKINPINSYSVMARDFVVSKPDIISYQ